MRLMLSKTRRLAARLVALGRREDGFTMVALSGVMLIVGLASIAAIAAADGDTPLTGDDVDRKEAYSAAEAGLNWYRFRLDRNTQYYGECVGAPVFKDAGSDAAQRANLKANAKALPGSSASYAIELLDYTECSIPGGGTGVKATISPTSGTFRVRVTGYSGGAKRSIVANVRRRGFLDFLYFTDYETLDPQLFNPANQTTCSRYARDSRPGSPTCRDIQFVSGDTVAGPLHTNDRLLICGTPAFGRSADDAIEMEGPTPGWTGAVCFPNTPNFFAGQPKAGAAHVGMPPTNTTLAVIAQQGGLRFQGRTQIELEGTGMRVTGTEVLSSGATQVRTDELMSLPPNGVIWVGNTPAACTSNAYIPANPNSSAAGCADVYLRGNYSEDLTIASEKDIIIAPRGAPGATTGTPPRGDVTRNGDVLLGLIANNFIRIYHPITGNRQVGEDNGNCTNSNGAGSMTGGVVIDAAILSLQHSFFVDSWDCGAKMGNITVNGAIAQKFRGPVGTSGGSGTGYFKSYNYDDRFRFRSPPYFLDPIQSPWRLGRVNEQVPAP